MGGPHGLKFDGPHAGARGLANHLGGELVIALVVIADFGDDEYAAVRVERADLHVDATDGLWKWNTY